MKNLLNPKILFFINTLPVLILFFLFLGEYNIIKSLLTPVTLSYWKQFAMGLSVISFLNLAYSAYSIIKKKELTAIYGFVSLIVYIAFLYLYGYHADDIIPFYVPRWMVTTDMFLYMGTFLMPTLIHSLLVLILKFTSDKKEHNPLISFLLAIGVPIFWYLLSQTALPLFRVVENNFGIHIILVCVIAGTLFFLFFLIRSIYIIISKKSETWKKYELAWKIPIVIVFPLLGLFINNGKFYDLISNNGSGVFGNFNSFWYYFIALANGVLLCLPKIKNTSLRLALFIGKSITFVFTLYFFVVFLPYLPVSVVAIIAVGLGFLMLTPVLLFVIHLKNLSADFRFLKKHYALKKLILIQAAALLVLPTAIITDFLSDKRVLNETLDYIYNPDYSKEYAINRASLEKTLTSIENQKDSRNEVLFGKQTPYLSALFNWLVLDNLTLSDKKINTIKAVFDGIPVKYMKIDAFDEPDRDVKINNIKTRTHFDEKQNSWVTWVDFEIKNNSQNNRFNEYSTAFELPAGCWISDYYLYIGNKKEMGLLAEKKAATWVFSKIRNENKDPGILYYVKNSKVAFKVFPFAENELRKTGIEFIHKEPVEITIDGQNIQLGNRNQQPSQNIEKNKTENTVYISASEKRKLPTIQRTPYYHFIVDVSKGKEPLKPNYIKSINTILNAAEISKKGAQISYANSYCKSESLKTGWEKKTSAKVCEGGFYLDRAIKKALFENYAKREKKFPVFIVVSDSIQNAIVENDFSDFEITYPESAVFYNLNSNGKLNAHSLTKNPLEIIEGRQDSLAVNAKVAAYPDEKNPIAFLPINDKADIVLKTPQFELNTSKKSKEWDMGLQLQGQWITQILYPEKAKEDWTEAVKSSFITKIMTPQTSYIVVENEAQKAMIIKKQNQVLSGNKALDPDEETPSMSEPGLIWLVFFLLSFLLLNQYRQKRNLANSIPNLLKIK